MLAPPMQLTGSTTADRNAVTWAIKEAMGEVGAVLTEARMFSNMSTVFTFELRAEDVVRFGATLARTDLRLSDASVDVLDALAARVTSGAFAPATELAGTLNVTFIHHDPDLSIDVPAVPG
jgi:hypothetical protein